VYIYFFSIVIFSIVLALSTNLVLDSTKKLSAYSGIGKYALASLILAMGTSLPELIIGIQAAINDQASLSLGNVLGSNIANLSIIIGGATIIGGRLKITKNVLNNDIYYAFLICVAPFILLIDGKLDRLDGVILIALLVFWQTLSASSKNNSGAKEKRGVLSSLKEKFSGKTKNLLISSLSQLAISLFALVFAADHLVKNARLVAEKFNIPLLLIGIFLIGLGSSLPELALELKSIKNKDSEVALGNLLGSIVINSSLIIGVTALIRPISLARPHLFLGATLFFLLIFAVFFLFIRTKSVLERWEGAILLMLYFILVVIEFT